MMEMYTLLDSNILTLDIILYPLLRVFALVEIGPGGIFCFVLLGYEANEAPTKILAARGPEKTYPK